MNQKITYKQMVAALESTGQAYQVLKLQNDVCIIVTQRGGRVFGPFLSEETESLFWVHEAFANPESFQAHLDSGDWNLGGERIWIAPEIQFNITDRFDFWNTYDLPTQLDPGNYALEEAAGKVRLHQQVTLDMYNIANGQKTIDLESLIYPVKDPLRNVSAYATLLEGVKFAGYERQVTLSEAEHDGNVVGTWNLIQVNSGGQLLILASPHTEATNYYDAIPDEAQTVVDGNHIRINITGDNQFKVGYKSPHILGRIAYFNTLDDGSAYLLVRNFFNNPSSVYPEEPPEAVGVSGDSVHVYNDGGQFGGFGEMECSGQTIGGATGKASISDPFTLWTYSGPVEKLKVIAAHLLGVTL
jgi:hypothetical protein